jgi:hypothetical protein
VHVLPCGVLEHLAWPRRFCVAVCSSITRTLRPYHSSRSKSSQAAGRAAARPGRPRARVRAPRGRLQPPVQDTDFTAGYHRSRHTYSVLRAPCPLRSIEVQRRTGVHRCGVLYTCTPVRGTGVQERETPRTRLNATNATPCEGMQSFGCHIMHVLAAALAGLVVIRKRKVSADALQCCWWAATHAGGRHEQIAPARTARITERHLR